MSDEIKKLTGKNKDDYQSAAQSLINNADVGLFKELVEKDSFLFDFIKENVANRLSDAVNKDNYRNLLAFLMVYSPSYEEFIIEKLVEFTDENLIDEMLEKFEHGTIDEKIYAAKYFSHVQDSLALPFLSANAFSQNEHLMQNCAEALAMFEDREVYNQALSKLKSDDEFEKLEGVKFLVSYGDKTAAKDIVETMKTSSLAENIAGELPYLIDLFDILQENFEDGLLVINNIINGIGEIIGLACTLDFELYNVLESLVQREKNSKVSVVLLNAIEKFDALTENDEYLFDESKETRHEVCDIKKLLHRVNKKELSRNISFELRENSPFVYTALEFSTDLYTIRELLKSDNQTIILKTVEVLKSLGNLDESTKTVAMLKVTDGNIKSIIRAL